MECPVDVVYGNHLNSPQLSKQNQVGTKIINLKEPERMSHNIKLYLHEKEESRQSELIAKEIEELKDCTFQPDVSGFDYKYKLSNEPVIVRGLGRHLELKNHSFRMKELEKQRKQDVFHVKNVSRYRKPETGTTIIEVSEFNYHNVPFSYYSFVTAIQLELVIYQKIVKLERKTIEP